jgi:NAD+ synthase (glutamine-hydrolysing)
VKSEFTCPAAPQERASAAHDAWKIRNFCAMEEFARGIALALFDYLRKSRAQGFVVSLSGGADSAAVACLVALMVRFSWAELGRAGFVERLGHIAALAAAANERDAVGQLLTTVYQSTENSGSVTRAAARDVANALGARHLELDVDQLAHSYVSLIEKALGRKLTWEHDDLALQNIQARVRAPSVWMLANVEGRLLLATSNRSEAAVGYATMDGDTAGSISPIAGIDKAFIRRWLVWLERQGPAGLEPIPALTAVNEQAPTAELRPPAARQTDEDDLMPYDVLDVIERAAIRDKRAPVEILPLLRVEFPKATDQERLRWLERFFRLFARNQWKRERYAPSFHVDDANLDPKTWCRFPHPVRRLRAGARRARSRVRPRK